MNLAHARLEAARQELLDLGLRNPLLNYRPLAARGVEVVDERPSLLYRHLVSDEGTLYFLPAPDAAVSAEGEWQGQPAGGEPAADRHHDDRLQTPYDDVTLQKRLLTTAYIAREYIEEQGVSVLFLALGQLHWREKGGQSTRRAPLLLIPVAMDRDNAQSRFSIRYTGADLGDNLPLRTKLALDFDLKLPPLPPQEDIDPAAYFASVFDAVGKIPQWAVDETAVSLGFFSFSKFLMYHDLDAATWPADRRPAAHPVLQALLTPQGFPRPGPQLDEEALLDAHIKLDHSHQVVDADSSQTLAILDVNAGHNLVIQGPPGTGKSQTITNLIAEAVGNGKKVLFVAEKMAALDVVKRRMDEVGLGDLCLELHSHKTSKGSVLAELGRTLRQGQPKSHGRFPHLYTLQTLRTHLNDYSYAINNPVGRSGVSLYDAYGHLLHLRARLADVPLPQATPVDDAAAIADLLPLPALATWSDAEFEQRLSQARALQECLTRTGVPAAHPLWGCSRQEVPEPLPGQIRALAEKAQASLDRTQRAAAKLAEMLETAVPVTLTDLVQLHFSAQRLQTAPRMTGVDTTHVAWETLSESLLAALEAGERIRRAHDTYDEWLIPEAWSQDVLSIRRGLMAGRTRWRRPFSAPYRRACAQLAGLCRSAPPADWETQLGAVDAMLAVQRLQPVLAEMREPLQEIFGLRWRGLDSNWTELLHIGGWLASIHDSVRRGLYPPGLLQMAARGADRDALAAAVEAIGSAREGYDTAVSALQEMLLFDPERRFGPQQTVAVQPFAVQQSWLQDCYKAADTVGNFVDYNRQARAAAASGLEPLVRLAEGWPHAAAHLVRLLQLARNTALVQRAQAERAVQNGYQEQSPQQTVAQFQRLDVAFLAHNRARLAYEHWQRLPRYRAEGQMGLLQGQLEKKRNHLPIRALLSRAGHAVQRIKPVFMMSPLSIAAYLPPESVDFDLVIFDEASQVRPVDALGAILRGGQVVVVGDSRQLPPTTFFERLLGDEEEEAPIAEESILDLFCAQNAPQRMLRWHYRSRHESLIAVSNEEFYDRRLVIFPSPDAARRDVGLRYHHLPQTVYRRGKSRTNPLEAEAVAAAVMAHARTQPELTLGVVTFSRGQRQEILQRLELLRRRHPETEPFFRAHPTEPFFVKNLENVQGDERDLILISVGYGRSADGRLTMNFGPLNQEGGERRLNVLITRARRRCEIFTNLTAQDIDLSRTGARGVAALRRYLYYAATGEMSDLPPQAAAPPAPFETALATELAERGFTVARRVGTGPVRVDLAIVDEVNGRYLLGIECDGDNYHLARSARDRDRIQAQVLRRLGWQIHRVWSQRWWQQPETARAELEDAIADPAAAAAAQPAAPDGALLARYDARKSAVEPRPIPPYALAGLSIDLGKRTFYHYYAAKKDVWRQNLLDWMVAVVEEEGPVHVEEVRRRMSHAAGYQVMTLPPIVADWMVQEGHRRELIVARGPYLWLPEMERPVVRDRSQLPQVSRKVAYIAPEEIAEAVLLVVQDALGIAAGLVPQAAGQLFGFRHLGSTSAAMVAAQVERLVENGRVRWHRGYLFPMQDYQTS